MTNQDSRSKHAADLRKKAETLARKRAARSPEDSLALSPEEIQETLHELRVHQVELEMQNEELRTAQKALEESRARYFDLYDLAPVGYCTLSEQGLILEANLTAATLLGETRAMLVRQPISRFIHKEDQDIHYLHRKVLFKTGKPQECELRLLKPDGALIWAHLTATTAQAEDGAPLCRVVITDISVRKRAEEVGIERLRLANILKGTNVATWEWNVQTGEQVINARWAEIIGYTLEELEPVNIRTWENVVHPDDQQGVGAQLELHFAEKVPYFDSEYRMRHKAGHWVWVRDRGQVISRTQEEKPIMMYGTLTDISERKRLEESLQKRLVALTRPLDSAEGIDFEHLFNLADLQRLQDEFAQATGVASIITRPDGTPITAQSNFCHLCINIIRKTEKGLANCYKSDAALGRPCHDGPTIQPCLSGGLWDAGAAISVGGRHVANWLIGQVRDVEQTEDKMRAYAREIDADEEAVVEAFRAVPSMSREQFERVAQMLFTLASQLSMTAYQNVQQARFITERKKAEEEIKNINQRLERVIAEKDKLFSIIAHDLRSPMSGLVVSTEMLAREPAIFSEQDFCFLATDMHKSARNTFELLEDLLQWARMSQGGMDFEPIPTSLDDLMTMGLSTGQDMARAKDITIRRDIPRGTMVLVDQPMLKTVIRNVLFNAIKFTHRGGEIVNTARQEGQTVTVSIQDNGIGMNEQVLSSIFSLEKEKRQLGTEDEKGTGLGLVLCKQFIEQHGGEIWVESEPGKGTTVFFTLPTQETRTPQTAEPPAL